MARPPLPNGAVQELLDDLHRDTPRLTGLVLSRIMELPAYANAGSELLGQLSTVVHRNVVHIVEQVQGRSDARDAAEQAFAVGGLRARQGLPLEDLLTAYRLLGQVLWEELVHLHRRTGTGTAEALLDTASVVWEEIDAVAAMVVSGYRTESRRLAGDGVRTQQAALERLLAGDDAAAVSRSARALGMPVGPYLCVTLTTSSETEVLSMELGAPLPSELTTAWAVRGATRVALVAGPRPALLRLPDQLRPGPHHVVVVSDVIDDLHAIPDVHRAAQLAASNLPAGVHRLEDRLPQALMAGAPDVVGRISRRTIGRLESTKAPDRAVLLDTMAALIQHQWSPTAAAQALYCHRNTVLHRLARLRDLLGEDPREPHLALLWQLALLDERP